MMSDIKQTVAILWAPLGGVMGEPAFSSSPEPWKCPAPISPTSCPGPSRPGPGACERWSKTDKEYVTVTRPNIVHEYNAKMGGVDLSDRTMSYYRMSVQTKKWTIQMLMHFTNLALANSWLLYHQDNQENGTPGRAIMKFLEFHIQVAQVFLNKHGEHAKDPHVAGAEEGPQPGKRSRVTPVPHVSERTQCAAHLPEMVDLKNPMRCRGQGCPGKSRVWCMTCDVFLCMQSGRNCYAAFHSGR